MFHPTNPIRKATVAVAFAVSLAALTGSQALAGGGSSTYHDGWYGYAVAQTKANQHPPTIDGRSPDTIDAALAARQREFGPPDGWYPYAVSITKQQLLDTRTPVQRIIAQENAQAATLDRIQALRPLFDGRSPDTIDAAAQAHSPVVTVVRSPGFGWRDFGIGVAAACGAMLLLGLSIRMLTARQAGKHPSSVATA